MTDLIDFVRLLTALVSLLTTLIGLSEALKQRSKQRKRVAAAKALTLNPRNGAAQLCRTWAAVDTILPTNDILDNRQCRF